MSLIKDQDTKLQRIKDALSGKYSDAADFVNHVEPDPLYVIEMLMEYIEMERKANQLRRKYDALCLNVAVLELQGRQTDIPSVLVERDKIMEELVGW